MWDFSTPGLPLRKVETEGERREMVNTKLISRIYPVGLGFPRREAVLSMSVLFNQQWCKVTTL